MGFKKNTAVTGFPFTMVKKTDGSAITSGVVTGYRSIDGSSQTALTNSPTHLANGQWKVNLTAAEMNGDVIGLLFTHTDAVNVHFTIKTEHLSIEKAAKMLVNKAVQDKVTGVIKYYNDDGEEIILTHTPTDQEAYLMREPS